LVVRLAATAALIILPIYDMQQQSRYHYLPTIDWPAALSSANDIAWLALALLGADLVAGFVALRAGRSVYARTSMEGQP
jgi:hypothetical protein